MNNEILMLSLMDLHSRHRPEKREQTSKIVEKEEYKKSPAIMQTLAIFPQYYINAFN